MQHRKYHTVNRFYDSSSDCDKSQDELFDDEYYQEFRNSSAASGSRIFRRWLLNIIDFPNTITNRLRDWLLRPTPGSRGSTDDKSSGTNSEDTSGIQLPEYLDDDGYFYKEKYEHSVKHDRDYRRENYRAPSFGHRYVKNHHVYHVYKQNEMGIERVVRGQRDCSTSWLQRNGRFPSSPVLVLPRIHPDTGLPIFNPRSHQTRTATERRSITHRKKNCEADNWRDTQVWEIQENHYAHLRGDTNLVDEVLGNRVTEKSSTLAKKNGEKRIDCNEDVNDSTQVELVKLGQLDATGATEFRETISMRVEVNGPQLPAESIETKDSPSNKIVDKSEIKNEQRDGIRGFPRLSTLTQNNVDALLSDLRQKINSLNAEKKFNRPVVRLASLIDRETGSQDRDHLFRARWQDKSGSFARDIKPAYTETRASFAERIQDIWTQERTVSQWAILHKHKKKFHGGSWGIERDEDAEDEREISNRPAINETSIDRRIFKIAATQSSINYDATKDRRTLKIAATQSSINYEISKPSVCHIGVQYISEATNLDESLGSSSSSYVLTQLPPPQEIQAFVQYKISEDLISSQPESKVSTERLNCFAERDAQDEKTSSTDKKITSMSSADNLQFAFTPQAIEAEVQIKISEKASAEKLPTKGRSEKFTCTSGNVTLQNSDKQNSHLAFQRQRKSLRCPFARLRKIRRKPRIFGCRFPRKVGLWLASKFYSGSRRGCQIPVGDDQRSFYSTKSSKLTLTVRSILKCIRKTSEINMTPESMKEGSRVPVDLRSNPRPMPPIRRKKLRAQNFKVKAFDANSTGEEKAAVAITEKSCAKEIPVDFSAIEPAASGNRRTRSERSMTTLSVTTSNSTNIPLQLLGSTSDTRTVPSGDSQDDFERQVDESNATEITTTANGEIETCEETDHYNSDSLPPEGSAEVGGTARKLEPKEDNEIEDSSHKIFNGSKILTDFSNKNFGEKSKLQRDTKKLDVKRRSQKKEGRIPGTVDISKKRSLNMENLSAPGNKIGATSSSVSDKSAQKLRLGRRTSRIDIVADKSPRDESESKNTMIRNAHNRRLDRRESAVNVGVGDSSKETDRRKSREPHNRLGLSSVGLDPTCGTRKLRRRTDSPMIPRRSTDSQNGRCTVAAGKSSLIPVGIGNARRLSTTSKTSDNEAADVSCNKINTNENKNRITTRNLSLIARPSLKKSLTDFSESKDKKNSNCRVRFEVERKCSKKADLEVRKKRRDANMTENLSRKIETEKIIRKVKSSLENGEPLKRFTILDPCLISSKFVESGAKKSGAEKNIIDQAEESCSSDQNFTRHEKTRLISHGDKESACPESSLSEQIPKASGSFEKRHRDESKISYRSLLIEKNKNSRAGFYPVERSGEAEPGFIKSGEADRSIVDFARIKEKVENEILEQTSRSSGTEDCDCAIVLIKAINSSMELSDA